MNYKIHGRFNAAVRDQWRFCGSCPNCPRKWFNVPLPDKTHLMESGMKSTEIALPEGWNNSKKRPRKRLPFLTGTTLLQSIWPTAFRNRASPWAWKLSADPIWSWKAGMEGNAFLILSDARIFMIMICMIWTDCMRVIWVMNCGSLFIRRQKTISFLWWEIWEANARLQRGSSWCSQAYTDALLEHTIKIIFRQETFHVETRDGIPFIWDDNGKENTAWAALWIRCR